VTACPASLPRNRASDVLGLPVNVNLASALRDSSLPCRVLSRHRLNFESIIALRGNLRGTGVKKLRRLAVLAALYGTVALASCVVAGLAGLGSMGIKSTEAPKVSRATSATVPAEHADAPRAAAPGEHGASVAGIASGGAALSDPPPMPRPAAKSLSTPDPHRNEVKDGAVSVEVADTGSGRSTLSDSPLMPQPATPPVLFAAASPTDPVQNAARPAVAKPVRRWCAQVAVAAPHSLMKRIPHSG
jgi:hypothetical protein